MILEKGWRCLDCTVCEGCGKATDEGRLLLCDDCDISYHLYCLDPPLSDVPEGNWKCKWCIKCVKCGSKTPGGEGCEWKNNYTECAICLSVYICPVCNKNYKENDIIISCCQCDRWVHGNCDGCLSEDDADKLANESFYCLHCKPNNRYVSTQMPNQIVPETELPSPAESFESETAVVNPASPEPLLPPPKRAVYEEGVYLTDVGSSLIKKIRIKPPAPPRRQRVPKSTVSTIKEDKLDDELSQASYEDKNGKLFRELLLTSKSFLIKKLKFFLF